jgi:hypothetical protein
LPRKSQGREGRGCECNGGLWGMRSSQNRFATRPALGSRCLPSIAHITVNTPLMRRRKRGYILLWSSQALPRVGARD